METIVEVDGQETVSFYSEGLVRTEWRLPAVSC